MPGGVGRGRREAVANPCSGQFPKAARASTKKALVGGAGTNKGEKARVTPHVFHFTRFGAFCKRLLC